MRNNLWLTGIGGFTALIFGFLAVFNYITYTYRGENYYLAGMLVYGTIALLSIFAVINGWRNALPGQRDEAGDETDDGDEPR